MAPVVLAREAEAQCFPTKGPQMRVKLFVATVKGQVTSGIFAQFELQRFEEPKRKLFANIKPQVKDAVFAAMVIIRIRITGGQPTLRNMLHKEIT